MAEQLTNYQCPACTGPLQFSPKTNKLECEFCGSSFDVKEIEMLYPENKVEQAVDAQGEWDYSDTTADWGKETMKA